jgi:hypothetical protein
MATATKERPDTQAPAAPAAAEKKTRPAAAVKSLNLTATLDPKAAVNRKPRKSVYTPILDSLYAATEAGQVGRDEESGALLFVKIAHFSTINGARATKKVLVAKVGTTFEFKAVTDADGAGDLYARVIETPAAA